MTYKPDDFLDRELSWLAFNERVLEEAEDSATPPLSQLMFLSIVSSNLDEFSMVRLAGLRRLDPVARPGECPTSLTAGELSSRVRTEVRQMVSRQYRCFADHVWPTLARQGLRRLSPHDLTAEQRRHVDAMFDDEIFPLLTPVSITPGRQPSRLPDLTITILARLEGDTGKAVAAPASKGSRSKGRRKASAEASRDATVAVVPLPASLPRMIVVPSETEHAFILLEDVVLSRLDRLFPGHPVAQTALFRLTRDADMSVEERKDEDFLAAMTDVLIQRRESRVVRMELAGGATEWAATYLARLFDLTEDDLFRVDGPLDLKAWSSLVNLPGLSQLRFSKWQAQPSPDLLADADLWETLRARDVLLHHPYESFDSVIRLVQEAAEDRSVLAIKQVLYRTSGLSKIIAALEQAALNGKQVSVLVELKARFDEARNIEWARRLERAGAQVVYGLAGLKCHAKALMIVRREPDRIRRYVHLATGNYNEVTARLYTDFGLMTSNADFGDDVAGFFNMVTGISQPSRWRKIAAAPHGLRQRLLHLIRRESERAQAGRAAMIMAKLNSLSDPEIITALYDASRAGVRVRLCVRGICCLRPGVKGLSETIEVVSIVGQFLEHSRILYFRNGGEEEVYLSSADWMTRNLDRRVELLFPVESAPAKRRLIGALELFLGDTAKGRQLGADGRYARPAPTRRHHSAQDAFMQMSLEASRRMRDAAPKELKVIKPPDRE